MELNLIHAETISPSVQKQVKCGICRNEITREAMIYQEGLTFGVVCEICYKNNSSDDLELMANLFLAYGGYFGKLKDEEFSLYDSLMKITAGKNIKNLDDINLGLIHKALLHGITPHQYLQSLKILLD